MTGRGVLAVVVRRENRVPGVWHVRMSRPGWAADVLVVEEDAPGAWWEAGDVLVCRPARDRAAAVLAAPRALSSAAGAGAAIAVFPGGCAWAVRGRDFAGPGVSEPEVELAGLGAVAAAVLLVAGFPLGLPEGRQHLGRVVRRVEIADDP